MEEHAEKLIASIPRADGLEYAIETLEIERSRLVEAIRAMRAMAVNEDDYPGTRVKEQRDSLESIERVLVFLRQAVEQSKRNLMIAIASPHPWSADAHLDT
jgi:hypothetical protein